MNSRVERAGLPLPPSSRLRRQLGATRPPPYGVHLERFFKCGSPRIDNYCPDASVQLGILGTTREARGKMILG